jgi:hypothetical protein
VSVSNSGVTVSNVSVVSATQITATFTIAASATPGAANVTVTTAERTSGPVSFTITSVGPTLTSISPNSGAQGATVPVTLTGTNFVSGATVSVSNTGVTVTNVTVVSATQITATFTIAASATPGAANVTVTTAGGTSGAVSFAISAPISLSGLGATPVPTQNSSVGVSLSAPATTQLDGTLTLSFTSNAAGTGPGYMDPGTQFLAGGTTLTFTIPAGSSTANLAQGGAIQQGTTAGTITVTLTQLTADGINVLPQPNPSLSVTVPPLAPVITSGSLQVTNQTSTGFTVQFDAYSTPRDLSNVTFTFQAASGAQLQGTSFSFPLDGTSWFSSTQGQDNGGTFSVTVPFTFSGDTSALGSVTVTLSNSVGSSSPATAAF